MLDTDTKRRIDTARDILAREGSEPAVGTSEQMSAFLAAEVARLGKVVRASRSGR